MSKGSGSTRSNAKLSSRDSATLSLNEKLGKYESYAKAQGSTMNEFRQDKYTNSYGLKINGDQTYISELTNKEAYGDQTGKFRYGTKNYDTFEEAYKAAERKLGAPKNNSAQPQTTQTQTQKTNTTAKQQTTESKQTSGAPKRYTESTLKSALKKINVGSVAQDYVNNNNYEKGVKHVFDRLGLKADIEVRTRIDSDTGGVYKDFYVNNKRASSLLSNSIMGKSTKAVEYQFNILDCVAAAYNKGRKNKIYGYQLYK